MLWICNQLTSTHATYLLRKLQASKAQEGSSSAHELAEAHNSPPGRVSVKSDDALLSLKRFTTFWTQSRCFRRLCIFSSVGVRMEIWRF